VRTPGSKPTEIKQTPPWSNPNPTQRSNRCEHQDQTPLRSRDQAPLKACFRASRNNDEPRPEQQFPPKERFSPKDLFCQVQLRPRANTSNGAWNMQVQACMHPAPLHLFAANTRLAEQALHLSKRAGANPNSSNSAHNRVVQAVQRSFQSDSRYHQLVNQTSISSK
jgi:hypothetical protein